MERVILARFVECTVGDVGQSRNYQMNRLNDIAVDSLVLSPAELEKIRGVWGIFLSKESPQDCARHTAGMAIINVHRVQYGAEPIIPFHQLSI
jgi:hypothetical protein